MTTVTYPANSPYHNTPQTSWHIGRFVYIPIPPDSGDTLYTLAQQHQYRPDKLSYDLYGTPAYWWIFCERNPFLRANPIWDFIAGLTIIVPSADYLQSILGI